MSEIELHAGKLDWSFDLPDGSLVTVQPRVPIHAPLADVRAAVWDAFENPYRLDFPLRRAFTPDDRIALVVDEHLPQIGLLVTETLKYLSSAGIGPDSVTILTAPSTGLNAWIDELPDEFADVHTEVHQPGDRKNLSYLATTKKGKRVYLNRTLVDADQIVVISGRRYEPLLGYGGCEGSIYPALCGGETREGIGEDLNFQAPTLAPTKSRAEAAEIASLLGSTIYLQVVEAAGDGISNIIAGLINSSDEGIRLLDDRWRFTLGEPVDVVLAVVGGNYWSHEFDAVAYAAANAARAVKEDGVIVVVADGEPSLGESMELLRGAEEPKAALRLLRDKKPGDLAAAFAWTSAAMHARIYLASGLRPELVEEIFATPILSPGELQRLLNIGGICLFLPDAQKSMIVVE
jgi:nickel-dependent lactate racemase